jgi:DNA-binding XRE family transcriptional regulator
MDDKSMQPWTSPQLTPPSGVRTMVHVGRPAKTATPAEYRKQFFQRVKGARALAGLSPAEMADELGLSKDTYYRYEERTMLPHHLIPLFCQICGITVEQLMTGRSLHVSRLEATGTDK